MDDLKRQIENLKIQGLNKDIEKIFNDLSKKEKKSKKPKVVPTDVGKKWKERKELRKRKKEKEKKDKQLKSITDRYLEEEEQKGEEDDFPYLGDVEYPMYSSDSDFGKKQKKDIKGMIKKILLYGGLPTLLVVTLGVLSNKNVDKGKFKKNVKVKKDPLEKSFKQDFKHMLKRMLEKEHEDFINKSLYEKENLQDTSLRQMKRKEKQKLFEYNQDNIYITPPSTRPPSPPSTIDTVERKPLNEEERKKQRLRKIRIRMNKKLPSIFDPNEYIYIQNHKNKEKFFKYIKKKTNYRINKEGIIEIKKKNKWEPQSKYYFDKGRLFFTKGGTIEEIHEKVK